MSSHISSRQRALWIGLITFGVLFSAFFGLRTLHAIRKFNGHRPPSAGKAETDVELIRDWMTIPFISRTYQVPPELIFETLKISPQKGHDKSLKELNEEYYPDQDGFVLNLVKETVAANNASRPPLPASAPTTISPPTAPAP